MQPSPPGSSPHKRGDTFFIPFSDRRERMCTSYKNLPRSDLQTRSMNDNKANHSPKMSRKTRTKIRKPKFLSLRTELSPESSPESVEMTRQHQLNLFPLHPENLFEERDTHVDNVAYFFDTDGGATLNGLLGGGGGSGGGLSSAEDSLTQSLPYSYGGLDSDEGANLLARTALRCQGRDARKEKWVIYSEVVEKKEDEVSSCESMDLRNRNQKQGLSLKLDYQEILNAWSDKGPLYIDNECPQTVPDLHDECSLSTMLADSCLGGNAGVQRVPDDGSNAVEGVDGEGTKGQSREARVLRYKEKRQSRLFSKRIRYEVRKLNAEKRPRMKGRFVKRN